MTKRESKVMRSFQIKTITMLAQGKFESMDIKNPLFLRWLVGYMADNNIPFKLIPLGANITRIIQSGIVCPHCMGKGFTATDEKEAFDLEIPESKNNCKKCSNGSCNCKVIQLEEISVNRKMRLSKK